MPTENPCKGAAHHFYNFYMVPTLTGGLLSTAPLPTAP